MLEVVQTRGKILTGRGYGDGMRCGWCERDTEGRQRKGRHRHGR